MMPYCAGEGQRLLWPLCEPIDAIRRWCGDLLGASGLGPRETPGHAVLDEHRLTLKAYEHTATSGPALLLVPAPIKQAYIWDLTPEVSVVQQCLRHHLRVYLLQWKAPGVDEQGAGLAEYASRSILACLRVIEAETGQRRAFLLWPSPRGTLGP